MLAFVLSREFCSRAEIHGVSIGVVEDFSFPCTQSVPLSCAFLVCKCLLSGSFLVESDGDWFWFLIIAEGSVVVGLYVSVCSVKNFLLCLSEENWAYRGSSQF